MSINGTVDGYIFVCLKVIDKLVGFWMLHTRITKQDNIPVLVVLYRHKCGCFTATKIDYSLHVRILNVLPFAQYVSWGNNYRIIFSVSPNFGLQIYIPEFLYKHIYVYFFHYFFNANRFVTHVVRL